MNEPVDPAASLAMKAIDFDAVGIFIGVLLFPLAVLPFIFLVLNYLLVYDPLKKHMQENARWPALFLGILELFLGGIIPGIYLLVCYSRIGNGTAVNAVAIGT